MTRLLGKIAIVTGVSRPGGIGAAICRAFAAEGASLFFTHLYDYDKNIYPNDADECWPDLFAEELRQWDIKVGHLKLDLALPGSWTILLEEVRKVVGFPTILVNNATYGVGADFRQLNEALIDAHCAVNVRGTFMLSAEFARMIEAKQNTYSSLSKFGGRIINLTSGQGKGPMPGNLAYAATKGAISAFTESLAAELAPLHITVNAVDPGPTDSGWMSEEIKKALLPQFPMGRIGLPEDAARLITFLATEESHWITGQIIHSRGGF
ncbi:3-oxoacyl-[acyl-carrier protein] reductase [Paenibacillus rhizosphaerae]|uniref:3-oxoacyl-[acyl-carrier protein] reductase n=1 Tax=Paenibacillus rhizosphaerae TaxID=297318 RepID=A0A839TZB4_9BACL|nr:SDR family oxidoreductase [Paenibacillus rhizosphaerae]MBB3132286.1 3-oxoacyl-[acyl-carrier protein] reductase [Paenibacillus rhizosphaerae]